MKKEWVKYICDPVDHTDLEILSVDNADGDFIISGILISKSGRKYYIKNGVPILVSDKSQAASSVESFGFEWKEFGFLYGKKSWIDDIVTPIAEKIEFFKDKVIIDAGAGSGSQSYWMAEAGAKLVFCLELSNSAQNVVKETVSPFRNNVFVIQTDISNPPINTKNIDIDLVYCMNVIQHTKDPKKATAALSYLLGSGGYFMYNIYIDRGRTGLLKILDFLRKLVSKFPYRIVKSLCFMLACVIYPISLISVVKHVVKRYLPTGRSFKETWLNIYDILGSHEYQKFYTRKEVEDIIKNANCVIEKESYYGFLLRKI